MPNYEMMQDPSGVLQIAYTYITEDGGSGVHLIPLDAVATRMALLNIDDPGQALDAILDEQGLGERDNPYSGVYAAMAEGDPEPLEAHREALDKLQCSPRCDARHEAAFKDRLRTEFWDYLVAVRWQFVIDHTAQLPAQQYPAGRQETDAGA